MTTHTAPSTCISSVIEACRPAWVQATEEERAETFIDCAIPQALAKAGLAALPFKSVLRDTKTYDLLIAAFNSSGEEQPSLEGGALLYTAWKLERRIFEAEPTDNEDALARMRFIKHHAADICGLEEDRMAALFNRLHKDMLQFVLKLEAA